VRSKNNRLGSLLQSVLDGWKSSDNALVVCDFAISKRNVKVDSVSLASSLILSNSAVKVCLAALEKNVASVWRRYKPHKDALSLKVNGFNAKLVGNAHLLGLWLESPCTSRELHLNFGWKAGGG